MAQEVTRLDEERLAEHRLTVRVGDLYAPDGLTEVVLRGDGTLRARLVREDLVFGDIEGREQEQKEPEVTEAEGEIPREQAAELIRRARHFPWSRSFPSRPGIPDEAVVEWVLDDAREGERTLKVWLREAEKDPELQPVLQALRQGLARISDNELYL